MNQQQKINEEISNQLKTDFRKGDDLGEYLYNQAKIIQNVYIAGALAAKKYDKIIKKNSELFND